MFSNRSRYANVENRTHMGADGRRVAYKARRFPPRGEVMQLLVEARVGARDRLDLIANRTLGNPELFWQIADANNALDPFVLTAEAGRKLRIPVPPIQGAT